MLQSVETVDAPRAKQTLLFALLLLFFFQLASAWIESIYRLSLVKLEAGNELFGVLLLFLPLLLFLVGERRERAFLGLALGVMLVSRAVCPFLGAAGLIIAGGLGVAAFLVVFCYVLSARYGSLQGDIGVAAGVAILLSVALRSWRSSLDVSMEGTTSVLGGLLILLAVYLFRGVMRSKEEPRAAENGLWRRIIAVIGLFSTVALVNLVLTSPAVVNAWYGGGAQGYIGVVAIVAVAFAGLLLALATRGWQPSRGALMRWNALFIVLLVGGIFLSAPTLPLSPNAGPVFVQGAGWPARMALYLMLALSPVVLFNMDHAAQLAIGARPRNAVVLVVLGMAFLFLVTLLLIATNVWGYVPYGPLFRNRFWLPFLLCGAGMFLPLFLRVAKLPTPPPACSGGWLLRGAVIALAVLGVVGALVRVAPSAPAAPRPLTIMTYNMQQGSHANANRDYREQLALLRKVNADIIGLQESDTARPSGGFVDAVRYFADGLGYFSYYGPNTVSGTFGAAILSRYPIRNPRTFFTYSRTDEVGTAVADIDVGGTVIGFFSNHPSGGDSVMNAHMDALIAEAAKYEYVISVGDYNFTPGEPYFGKLAAALDDSATALGEAKVNNHGKKPNLAEEIDHIFVSRNFRVLESHYLPPPDSKTDHPAHWSIVQLGPGSR
jgi:endonuclease/exonuclease/phosphatase family metal-dependent hydrolase